MKKIFFLTLLAFICVGCKNDDKLEDKYIYRIGVLQLMTNPGIDAIREGFLEEMNRLGYREGENIIYSQQNSQGDNNVAVAVAKKFVKDTVDLIFAITTPTAQVCAQEIKGTKIPLVFGAVTDPISAGLITSMEHPDNNITGTSDKWPTAAQFDLLVNLLPDVKRIGVVYNPGETNSDVNIREVEKVCRNKGLQLIKVTVSNTNEVYMAAKSLVGKIDAFYVSADNTVITAMDAVVKVSEKNKIPLMPGVSSNIEQGGFGTLGPDYFDIGMESAKIVDKILKGSKPSDISVTTATRFEYFFNSKSAKLTNVNIPDSLLKKATKVY